MTRWEHPSPAGGTYHGCISSALLAISNRPSLLHQIEHHLFPNVCHIHFRALAPIVKRTAEEFGLPYRSSTTFAGALALHARMLWKLGRQESWA